LVVGRDRFGLPTTAKNVYFQEDIKGAAVTWALGAMVMHQEEHVNDFRSSPDALGQQTESLLTHDGEEHLRDAWPVLLGVGVFVAFVLGVAVYQVFVRAVLAKQAVVTTTTTPDKEAAASSITSESVAQVSLTPKEDKAE
jgi:hypothetical protein